MTDMEKTNASKPDDPTRAELLKLYEQVCSGIKETDAVSFKLLGAVPLASAVGSGALTLLGAAPAVAVAVLSVIGATVVLGLLRWELRNVQKCNWLISRAAILESNLLPQSMPSMQYGGVAKPEHVEASRLSQIENSAFFSNPSQWGKTQSITLIYTAATLAWVVPLVVALQRLAR